MSARATTRICRDCNIEKPRIAKSVARSGQMIFADERGFHWHGPRCYPCNLAWMKAKYLARKTQLNNYYDRKIENIRKSKETLGTPDAKE